MKPTGACTTLAVAFTTALVNLGLAAAVPYPGKVTLENWMLETIPRIFPNTTTNWQPIFEDNTIAPDVKLTFNARSLTGRESMRALWAQLNSIVVSRLDEYVLEPTGVVAFALDEEGRSGWVIATSNTYLKTKEGDVYTGGGASAFVSVTWSETLQKRVVTEWKEVNTPPNYPNYPWS